MSWHRHTWNLLSGWKCFVAIFGCLILKNGNAHGCHQHLAAGDQQKSPLFILVKFHELYLIIYSTPHSESHPFLFFFLSFFLIKFPHGCTIQTFVFGCHEGEYLQSDSIQMKSPPSGCLVWSCPFGILSKWFYCFSFYLLRDNCTNQVKCSLKSDS